ncbi:AsmA family protein [Marinagarivorans algicola]|uniref:AsmA family protein n=1 Tax=Marinagarivorans algicola TaxID=1513270 RepID=UPI0037356725
MSKLKSVLVAFFVLPLLIIAGGAAFILTLDPNRLKPLIAEAAGKQGLSIEIDGDINWRLYPNIGLDIAGISVSNKATAAALASLKSARLDVALKPLLGRKIEVVGVAVDGAEVHYLLEPNGQSNWPVIEAQSAPTATETQPKGDAPQINIAALFVTDLSLKYRDARGVSTSITGLNAEALGVNLSGRAFEVILQSSLSYTGYPDVWFESAGTISVDMGLHQAILEAFKVSVYVERRKSHEAPDLVSEVAGTLNWGTPLSAKTTVSLKTHNLRQLLAQLGIPLPATQDPQAFTLLEAQANIDLKGDVLNLGQATIKLDKTTARAALAVTGFKQPKIQTSLEIDTVNADAYMAPALDKSATKAKPTPETEQSVATPLPFELLRQLDIKASLALGQLHVKGITANKMKATLRAKNGLITLKPYSFMLAQGSVNAELELDAQKNTRNKGAQQERATLKGWLTTQDIELSALLEQLKQEPLLVGDLGSRVTVTSEGHTDQDIINNMKAGLTVDSKLIKLTRINIEKSFCEAVSLLSGKPTANTEWPSYSELSPLSLKAQYANNKIELQSLSATIQKLKATSSGVLDLESGDFRFPLDVSLAEFAGGLEGCAVVDAKWRKRAVPLRCKGNLINIGAKTCLPDGPRITEYLKGKAKQKIDKKLDEAQDKVEDKAKKEADRFLEKHVEKDKIDDLKESVKGLFKFK